MNETPKRVFLFPYQARDNSKAQANSDKLIEYVDAGHAVECFCDVCRADLMCDRTKPCPPRDRFAAMLKGGEP